MRAARGSDSRRVKGNERAAAPQVSLSDQGDPSELLSGWLPIPRFRGATGGLIEVRPISPVCYRNPKSCARVVRPIFQRLDPGPPDPAPSPLRRAWHACTKAIDSSPVRRPHRRALGIGVERSVGGRVGRPAPLRRLGVVASGAALERLLRYGARPPLSLARLAQLPEAPQRLRARLGNAL